MDCLRILAVQKKPPPENSDPPAASNSRSDGTTTSFPGSLFFPPPRALGGGKKRDPGNEVDGTTAIHMPPFTGDNTPSFLLPQSIQSSCLPPLIIAGIGHVKNIAIFETEALAGETAVLRFVIVKQSPGEDRHAN